MEVSNDKAAADPANPPQRPGDSLTEDEALALLKQASFLSAEIEQLSKQSTLMKSRKVRFAMAAHAHTPRRIALRLIRELYTFDLMRFTMTPVAPADLRRVADELIVSRLNSITLGERIALARRSSEMVAGALLLNKETRVWKTALDNPRLTESSLMKAVQRSTATPAFVDAVCRHSKWSVRAEIRLVLLRTAHLPLAKAIEFASRLPPAQLSDILHASRLPEKIKDYLRKDLDKKSSRRRTDN